MIQNRSYLVNRIQDCINSYYPDRADWHEGDDITKPLKPGYAGQVEDYSQYESHERFSFGTDRGYIWRATIQDKKCFGVTITGTDSPIDWALNFCAEKTQIDKMNDAPYGYKTQSGVAIHDGFLFGYQQVREFLLERTAQAIFDGCIIIGSGHSRGAALMQIYALDASKKFCDDMRILSMDDLNITLVAPPRVFNEAGALSYDARVPRTTLIINGTDPVCNAPFDGMGYRQVARARTVRIGFKWYSWLSPLFWIPAALGAVPFLPVNALAAGVSAMSAGDHYPMHYMQNMLRYGGNLPQ
jgi:hypothetical protein